MSRNRAGFQLEREEADMELFPVAEKEGFSFAAWCDAEGRPLSVETIAENKIFFASFIDDISPTFNYVVTKELSSSQEIELTAEDNGSGIEGYYCGKKNPNEEEVEYRPENIKTITDPGMYYCAVKDGAGNVTVCELELFTIQLENEPILLEKGISVSLPEPQKEGYSGVWIDEQTNLVVAEITAMEGQSYTIQWTPNRYLVCFDGTSEKEVTFSEQYGELPTPSAKYGYSFVGWYTEQTGGTQVLPETIVENAQNHTLYAQWNYTHVHTAGCYQSETCNRQIVCRQWDVFDDGEISYTHVCPNCGGVGGGRCGGGHTGQICGNTITVKICGLP